MWNGGIRGGDKMRGRSPVQFGAERLFSTGGEVFFPMRVARVRTVRPGAGCPLFRRGASRRRTKGRIAGGCSGDGGGCVRGGERPSSYRASRCGFPVPRPPVRRDPSSSRGGARHGSIGAGRGEEGGARKKDRREGRPFLPPVCMEPDRLRWSDDSGSSPVAVVGGRIAPASYVVRLGRERSVSEGKDGICAAENSGSQKVRLQSGPFAGAP